MDKPSEASDHDPRANARDAPSRPIADFVLVGASELVTCRGSFPASGADQKRVAVIEEGALAARDGEIVWVGPEHRLRLEVDVMAGAAEIDVQGRVAMPGFVDAHTHLVWAGDRADEFARRLAGATYQEIAAAGGGILGTVDATRRASLEELTHLAGRRMARLCRNGTTAIEVKSGYGLSADSEIKILEAARLAARNQPFEVVTTFLGAHTFPREARASASERERYLDLLCEELMPRIAEAKLARFADVFIDEHAFSIDEGTRVLVTARDLGLAVKIHADQISDDGAAMLAAQIGATSADHLEHANERGLEALARAGTVAVLIPGASLFLQMDTYAPARKMIDLNVPVALATDLNPGTCPCESMPLIIQLACLQCGLSIDEAIVAATLNAAAASGLADRCGSLEVGKRCDLVVLDAEDRRQLAYRLGAAPIHMVIAQARVMNT